MKFSRKNFENWRFWKISFFSVGHFEIFFSKKNIFFASFSCKMAKVSWLARMGQNFDQAKCDNTFWPRPNILTGSVTYPKVIFCFLESLFQQQIMLISHRSEFWNTRRKTAMIFSKLIFFKKKLWFH